MILCDEFITRACTIPLFMGIFGGIQFLCMEILVCISRLWRRKKLVLSPHRKLCRDSTMTTETSLDDALGVYGAFGVHDA